MVKKGIVIGAGVLVLLGLLFGRDGLSHVKTAGGMGQQAVHDACRSSLRSAGPAR